MNNKINRNAEKVKNDIKTHLLYSNASWTDYMHRSVLLALLCILIWAFNLNMWGVLHSEHKKDWTFPNKALAALPPVILTETNEAVRKAPESRDTAPHPDNGKDGGLVGLINKTFGEHADRAVRIFNCESHLDPSRHSGVVPGYMAAIALCCHKYFFTRKYFRIIQISRCRYCNGLNVESCSIK